MTNEQLKILLERFAGSDTTPEEEKILLQCFADPEYETILKDFIAENWDNPRFEPLLNQEQSQELYQSIQAEITSLKPARVKAFYRRPWMAAASIAILIAAAGIMYLLLNRFPGKGKDGHEAVAGIDSHENMTTDVAPPSSSNAVLFFDDGAKISLNKVEDEMSDKKAGMKFKKLHNGQIIYDKQNNGIAQQKKDFNTLYNPRGSQMASVILSDGTKVWLNAESSLKYPVRFTGPERRVEISGEAYFEVARLQGKPFLVSNGKTLVRVLGTHFNVNTYGDNGKVIVTLLEGAVKVTNDVSSEMLKPGQQAQVGTDIQLIHKSDTTKALAWKNEVFNFTQTGIAEIMKEMERWYDVKVEYDGAVPDISLSGIIDRNINASKVLEMLEISSGLDFRIEGRKIIVKKK